MFFRREPVLPVYDFSEALLLSVMQRLEQSVEILQEQARATHAVLGEEPLPPQTGLSEDELAALQEQIGAPIPTEYADFLRYSRQLDGEPGFDICGQTAWPTDEDFATKPYLVIGNYYRYADGDALMMPLAEDSEEVVLYLHEDGPKMETFAPSFSLALWRMAHEKI
jgi:hypothetical protein